MKLMFAAMSPFVRKVVVLLNETGQTGDVELVDVATSPLAPADAVRSSNPVAKIPALIRDDGSTLYDSRVICAYLDDRASGKMYPSGPARWDTLVLEATADGIMDAAVSMAYEKRLRPAEKQWPEWVQGQLGKVLGGCKGLNDRWIEHLRGPMDMGHIAVGCALGYVDARHPDSGWRDGNDDLAAWYAEFESRPSMQATRPPAA